MAEDRAAKSNQGGKAWADISPEQVATLIAESRRLGWRTALEAGSAVLPFFRKRMLSLGLGNWHLLTLRDRSDRSLDVGCGFGSLPLGLAKYYRTAVGAEFLPDRVEYATLRAREDGADTCRFARSTGHALPFDEGTFGLVTMNGVLEWAGLYAEGDPRDLQVRMLREARRVLRPDGHVAVAIENRFAMESLLGMPDTHTGVIWPTVLPRWMADKVTRLRTGEPYRTYLYNPVGYRRLLHDAGFSSVRLFDLISSYNDYDFIVETRDAASYRFLYRNQLVRPFFGLAGRARRILGRLSPGALSEVSYAYLVLGGQATMTILDPAHPVWHSLAPAGADPGRFRFAVPGQGPAQLVIVCHDGERATALVEITTEEQALGSESILPRHLRPGLSGPLKPVAQIKRHGVSCRVFLPGLQ